MPGHDHAIGLFPALLKYWRRQRGLSQLDLAVAADVSARHISFLETGRSVPSAPMVRQLARTLGLPLRHMNEMLRSAGHAADDGGQLVPPESVRHAIELLKTHHEPFPLLVVDRVYCVLDANRAAHALLHALAAPAPGDAEGARDLRPNLARMAFDPAEAQPHLVNFAEIGREILWRIQRELLADPDDAALRELLDELLAMPTVDPDWRRVDLAVASEPALVVHLRLGSRDLRFLTAVTAFQAPQNMVVEQLRIEQWLPYDEVTVAACEDLFR
jgi:transcriptional regulator with XRE-family HTH domain